MKLKLFLTLFVGTIASLYANAIEYPDYYCEQEAWSFGLPVFPGYPEEMGYHTTPQYKIGDFYYWVVDEDKSEVAVVAPHPVFETCDHCHVACPTPSVIDWQKGTYSGDIEIPAEVTISDKTYSVVMLGYGLFFGCEELHSVKIPNSVRLISSYV